MPNASLPQFRASRELTRSLRETYAEALRAAETTYRDAQAALALDDSNENRARYAKALFDYDRLQADFPSSRRGLGIQGREG